MNSIHCVKPNVPQIMWFQWRRHIRVMKILLTFCSCWVLSVCCALTVSSSGRAAFGASEAAVQGGCHAGRPFPSPPAFSVTALFIHICPLDEPLVGFHCCIKPHFLTYDTAVSSCV